MKKFTYSLEDLKKLIKSLSGAERRHFSLLSSAFITSEKEPLYLKLFQHLLQDETELSDLNSLPELTTIKKRLFKNILKSLRAFHQDKSIEINIQNCLSDIEILYSLGLPKQSYYLLQRAYVQALANEKFTLLLPLLEWEKKLNMILDNPSRSIAEIANEEKHVLKQLTQLLEVENLFSSMKSMKREYGQMKGGIAAIPDNIKAFRYEDCISNKAKFYHNFTFAIYNWITYNHKDAYKYSKELLSFEARSVLPGDYIDGILEHSTSCIQVGKFDEALQTLELAKKMMHQLNLEHVPVINTKLFFYTAGYHLMIYNYTGDKQQLEQTIYKLENEIKQHEDNMPLEAKQVLLANLMIAYLGIGNHKKVDETWESLFQKASKSIRRNIYDDLRLFRLFHLLQHKSYDIIPSMALSAYRYYNKPEHNAVDFELELKLSALMLKEYDYEKASVKENIFNTIKETINHYIKSFNNADFLEHYTLYEIWIRSIQSEQPFNNVAAAWYDNYSSKKL